MEIFNETGENCTKSSSIIGTPRHISLGG